MNRFVALCVAFNCFVAMPLLADGSVTVRFSGKVSDEGRQPLSGVNVMINRVSGAPIDGSIDALKTVAGTNGAFDLSLRLQPTTAATVECELWFEQKGFVRAEEVVRFTSNTNATNTLNIVLRRGEILSGVIKPASPTKSGRPSTQPEAPLVFMVSGGDWEQAFVAGKDGAFEIFVPRGEYRLSVLTGQPFEINGVKSGTTNLLVAPQSFVWSAESVGKVFDEFWQAMDRQYSYFFLKTNVDWRALKDEFRPQAIQATNASALAKTLQRMLVPLRDLHVWIETPEGGLGTYTNSYVFNGNGRFTRQAIEETSQCGKFAVVGKTKRDGFGYFMMLRQSNATEELVKQAATAIDNLRDVPGFIVDLRAANGGNEALAQVIAQRFCAKKIVYAKSRYRNGASHTAFSRDNERVLTAGKNPFTKPVVCVIGPGAVSSGEGFVKMMQALPHVTTVGMPTRGASGNPKPFPLGTTGVTVMFSRWVDLMPTGETFEGRGIPPDVTVDEPPSSYTERDPTLEKALEVLRQKIATANSKP